MAGPNYSGLLLDMAAQPESGPPQPDWARRLTPFLPPPDPSFGLRDNPYAQGVARGIVGIGQGVATLPQRAFGASEAMRQGGNYDPGPILEAAMLPMTGGIAAPLRMGAGEAALGAGPIRAYHGSPYDFEKFDLSKIGTGEGAQAYGHGLYFAENPETAKAYREALKWRGANWDDPQVIAKNVLDKYEGDRTAAIKQLEDAVNNQKKFWSDKQPHPPTLDAINLLKSNEEITGKSPTAGKTYEVDIDADPEHFLDWDKPLSEQHPKVQEAIQKRVAELKSDDPGPRRGGKHILQSLVEKDATGADVYGRLAYKQGAFPEIGVQDHAAATQSLRDAGIPGIKYLDQGSRPAQLEGKTKQTHNYVVFDDKTIDILRKYGIPGLIGGGASTLPRAISRNDESQ